MCFEELQKFNKKFNETKPWPMRVKQIHKQYQTDLVDIQDKVLEYNGVTY